MNNFLGAILAIIFVSALGYVGLREIGAPALDSEISLINVEPISTSGEIYIQVVVMDNGVPVPDHPIALYYGDRLVDEVLTDTDGGRAYLHAKNVDELNPGRIVLIRKGEIPSQYINIVYKSSSYSKIYYFNVGNKDEVVAGTDVEPSFQSTRGAGTSGSVGDGDKPTETVEATSTPTPTVEPLLKTDEFNDSSIDEWTSLGPVDSSRSDRFVGNVQIKEGELHFNLYMVEGYWVYNVEMPMERSIEDLLFQSDIRLSAIPENGVSRFHVQLRRQLDNRYYSVVMDHTNVITIYYVSLTDEGFHYKELHAFHADGFDPELNAVNTLKVNLKENVFRIQVNNGQIEEYTDTVMFIEGPGLLQLGIDGPEDEIVNYHIDELVVREWP